MNRIVNLMAVLAVLGLEFVSGAIVINEIELNPEGGDSGNEWVEIFNNGSEVNLTGWFLRDSGGSEFFFPGIKLGEDGFYVFNFSVQTLVNSGENLSLFNVLGFLKDSSGLLEDNDDDNRTWQRIPDGIGNFTFLNETKGFANERTVIGNKSIDNICVLSNEKAELSVNVMGFCVEEVVFSIFVNGTWHNFSGEYEGGGEYIFDVNNSLMGLAESSLVNWTVFAKDCFNNTVNNGGESFYVNDVTELSVFPNEPDGLDGWYVTEPTFVLENDDASEIYYHWDSTGEVNYTGPFELDGIPNAPPKESAGVLVLKYSSNVCNNTEGEKSEVFRIDLVSPRFVGLMPENNSVVRDSMPRIKVRVDELYQSNSGVDIEKVDMELRGYGGIVFGNFSVIKSGLDADVEFFPLLDLSGGRYNASVNATDLAGRNSYLFWFFDVNLTESSFNMSVNSPEEGLLGERRVGFNVSTSKEVEVIEYINHNERRPRYRRLCRDCDSYGFFRKRTKNLNEGVNNITIRAVDENGDIAEENILFFVDSYAPRIFRILPRKKSVTNGTDFLVRYSEENVEGVELVWNPSVEKLDCPVGRNVECEFDVSSGLGDFDGQIIIYHFLVSDELRNASSKEVEVLVDVSVPELDVRFPEVEGNYSDGRVPFNITISEEVTLEYKDLFDRRPRFRRLCSRCDEYGDLRSRIKRLRGEGEHELIIRATDRAGNSDVERVSVVV